MIMIVFTLALIAGSTRLLDHSPLHVCPKMLAAVSLGSPLIAPDHRRRRERAHPVDNPATHLELTMVHEAMILEIRAGISR